MNSTQFREFGKAAVDFIADYLDNIRDRSVLPDVEPGYLHDSIPDRIPEKGEKWQDVLADVEKTIMPGMTHWQSPRFHAYYPAASSYPSIVGEMLAAGFGCLGFSWITSPVCTELEVVMMNWLGRLLNLPEEFMFSEGGKGGGIIQGSASEATFIALLAAKSRAVRKLCKADSTKSEDYVKARLVGYASDQANSSVEKAGLVGSVPMRLLPSNEKGELTVQTLEKAILADIEKGLIPCFVVATFGSTGTCSIDDLNLIGPICNAHKLWLHVDAAYAGAALILPEYTHLGSGLKYADSFDFNLHKWLLVNFDCSAMWVKDSSHLVKSLNVDRIYLKHKRQGQNPKAPDYRGEDNITKLLYDRLMERGKIYLIVATAENKLIIRFCVCSQLTETKDIEYAWSEIAEQATVVLSNNNEPILNGKDQHLEKINQKTEASVENCSFALRAAACTFDTVHSI